MFGFIRIRTHERGVWLRDGEFYRLVGPGRHWLWRRLYGSRRDRIERFNALDTRFSHALLDVIAASEDAARHLLVVELADEQRAVVSKDGRAAFVLGPGRHAFWRTPARLSVQTYAVAPARLDVESLDAILALSEASKWLESVVVEGHEEALLFRDGVLIERLGPGRHVYWKRGAALRLRAVDLREQIADVSGQEIMTADKVALRVNLVVSYRVVDAAKFAGVSADAAQALYREAQLALREAIGARTLDGLLADKQAVGAEVAGAIAARAAQFGAEVRGAGLRDVILPGDVREIVNQVVAAEKQAQANLIRRREETAAARSQANTAKLLAENPVLARIKELELLQEILAGAKATFVLGSGDLSRQFAALIGKEVTAQDRELK